MAKWFLRTEPDCWSWADQEKVHKTWWDDVKNPQAAKNLKRMEVGDLAFFYHTGKEKRIVGVVRVEGGAEPDPDAKVTWGVRVPVSTVGPVPIPVPLALLREQFPHLDVIRQPQLSVGHLTEEDWVEISHLAGWA